MAGTPTTCEGCGWTYGSLDLRSHAAAFVDACSWSVERPAPEVWSPLEYACHVRDVLTVQLGRVALGLVQDTPRFEPMGRDERPARLHYSTSDPVAVREQLLDAAGALADVFDALDELHLERTIIYTWPAEMVRTLRWVGEHTVHELVHHRLDVEAQVSR